MLKALVTLGNILGVAQLQHELVEGLGYWHKRKAFVLGSWRETIAWQWWGHNMEGLLAFTCSHERATWCTKAIRREKKSLRFSAIITGASQGGSSELHKGNMQVTYDLPEKWLTLSHDKLTMQQYLMIRVSIKMKRGHIPQITRVNWLTAGQ